MPKKVPLFIILERFCRLLVCQCFFFSISEEFNGRILLRCRNVRFGAMLARQKADVTACCGILTRWLNITTHSAINGREYS